MSRVITEADLPAPKPNRRLLPSGQRRHYPWYRWTDGQIWQLFPGDDFDVTAASMRATVYGYAAKINRQADIWDMGDGSIAIRITQKKKQKEAA